MEVWKTSLDQPLTLELQWPTPSAAASQDTKMVQLAACFHGTVPHSPPPSLHVCLWVR